MQLFVKKLSGRTVALRVEPNHTVGRVKSMVTSGGSASALEKLYMCYDGRVLSDETLILGSGVREYGTLTLGLRLCGGGGDGGATGAESRDCYLKMYADKKPDKFDPYEAKLAKSTRCTMSAESLKPPCVMDYLGNLYNKEAVVQALLTKSVPKKLRHVLKGLKDVIDIHLSSIPGVSPDDESAETKFQCPITGSEFNGKFRFVALRGCGHVLSEKALKEVKTATCLVCFVPYVEADKMIINGTEEEVIAMRERWEVGKAKSRGDHKEKKSQNGRVAVVTRETDAAIPQDGLNSTDFVRPPAANGSKRKTEIVVKVPDGEVVRPKGSDLIQQSKKFKAAEVLLPANATKEVFASIFTSSSKNELRETYSCRSLPIGRN
ncbi:unnamed protein product [Calypogeia fissa]